MRTKLKSLVHLPMVLSLLVPSLMGAATGDDQANATRPGKALPSSLRVAVANVREGAPARIPADIKHASDRKAFARRLFAQPGRAPDVVLLQEVLGSAARMAAVLNAHPRAGRTGARYAVAAAPRILRTPGVCDGRRNGSFTVVRDSAILVNRATVRSVRQSGNIRTWGRWGPAAHSLVGRSGFGCSEHPWLRIIVQQPGARARAALVASAHVAPVGISMKNHAMARIRKQLGAQRRKGTGELVVAGGDLNLNRCLQPLRTPEQWRCSVREGHRAPCRPSQKVFARNVKFLKCQARSLNVGRPGASCPANLFRRYYSDHPIQLATLH